MTLQVSAQTLRLLFASQPWARAQISEHTARLPLDSLLRSHSPKLVEQTACLVADLNVYNSSALLEHLDLASILPSSTCTAACQKCVISSMASPGALLGQTFSPAADKVLLQWAGLLPMEDLSALKLLSYATGTAAAALVIAQAATPAGRAAIMATPIVPELQAALQLSATPRHTVTAARAARLLGNLAQDARFVAQLQASHDLEPLLKVQSACTCQHAMTAASACEKMQRSCSFRVHKQSGVQVLMRRIGSGEAETLPGCAIAVSNLAAGSKRARLALQAMRAPSSLAAAARDSTSGAAHMALLQALLATSQVRINVCNG